MFRSVSSALETKCLNTAKKHLSYVTADPKLGFGSREYKIDFICKFYTAVFNNLGMLVANQEWGNTLSEVSNKSLLSGRKNRLYSLKELLEQVGVTDNKIVFRVLEDSGADIVHLNKARRKGFFVNVEGVQKIVNYLYENHNINYDKLKVDLK